MNRRGVLVLPQVPFAFHAPVLIPALLAALLSALLLFLPGKLAVKPPPGSDPVPESDAR